MYYHASLKLCAPSGSSSNIKRQQHAHPNVVYLKAPPTLKNLKEVFCYVRTSLHYTDTLDCLVYFFLPPPSRPMYDMIWSCSHVRYNLVLFPCTIQSGCILVYDINLGAMHTTILSIRGVTIPIYLVSSATDSIRQRVVLFKPVPIPTLDPKSEFLCQSSLSCEEPTDPLNTSYAWDISHALVTTYHPYCHSPGALTEYLKQKLRHQRAKRLGRSLPAQVEQNIPLERNIFGMAYLKGEKHNIIKLGCMDAWTPVRWVTFACRLLHQTFEVTPL